MITAKLVTRRLEEIKQMAATDPLGAAQKERALWEDVLRGITYGRIHKPAHCAEVALRTREVGLLRW